MNQKTKERADSMGDRMKAYERIETDQRFRPNSVIYARLDGRSFSKFTKGLARPYDVRLSNLMIAVTKNLVKEFRCMTGYTQSDEISLVLVNKYDTPMIFEGKKQKLISTMAAHATAVFNSLMPNMIPEKTGLFPSFDCRAFEIPATEISNSFLWREQDAARNSVSMLAQHHFSHKELQGRNTKVMIDMLKTRRSVIWDDCPDFFKHGTYVKRVAHTVVNPAYPDAPATRHYVEPVDVSLLAMAEKWERDFFTMTETFVPPDQIEQMGT